MIKKVMIAGVMGGLTLIIWSALINGFMGFRNRVDMKQVPSERQVYEILKQNIVEPGRYLCNPALTSYNTFPENEPVFSILYGGVGHEAAGVQSVFMDLFLAFLATTIGAWLLSLTSERILLRYPRKVLFCTIIGLLIAVFTDLNNFGIGNYPFTDALILALHNIVTWTVVGLIISLFIKPRNANPEKV